MGLISVHIHIERSFICLYEAFNGHFIEHFVSVIYITLDFTLLKLILYSKWIYSGSKIWCLFSSSYKRFFKTFTNAFKRLRLN